LWVLIGGLNPEAPVVSALFLAAEVMCLVIFTVAAIDVWDLRFKPRGGLAVKQKPSVDVYVPVCGEPMWVVERAIESASKLEWDGLLSVYVLDEKNSDAVRSRAEQLGIQYLSRAAEGLPQTNAKAGNLNYALERTHGELVFILDADHAVRRDALDRMAGYMSIAKVGIVQSKQSYLVPEDDPFNSQDPVFYDAIQLGFDADDTVISCGSGVLYRREALDEIGGFAEWNLVEDLTTSYEMQSAGWKGLYYPYPVTIGLAPGKIEEVYQQRYQWTVDTMRIFFWDNPLLKPGLKWRQRLNHLVIGSSYIWAGFFMPVFFMVPLWTYLTGTPLFVAAELPIVLSRLVYFVLFAVAAELLFRGKQPGKQFQFLAGMFPVYVWGTIRALFSPPGRKPEYRVNNLLRQDSKVRHLLFLSPQLALLAANALLPFYALYMNEVAPWVLAANILVSAFTLWTMWPIVSNGLTHRRSSLDGVEG
jgi:cellulose synthase (UDP-forming)